MSKRMDICIEEYWRLWWKRFIYFSRNKTKANL